MPCLKETTLTMARELLKLYGLRLQSCERARGPLLEAAAFSKNARIFVAACFGCRRTPALLERGFSRDLVLCKRLGSGAFRKLFSFR